MRPRNGVIGKKSSRLTNTSNWPCEFVSTPASPDGGIIIKSTGEIKGTWGNGISATELGSRIWVKLGIKRKERRPFS